MQEVPLTPSVANYHFTVTIGVTPVRFDAHWNSTEAAWYLDARELDDTVVFIGAKIVIGALLGRSYPHPLLDKGAFMARDFSRENRDPTFDDLGIRVKVFYVEADMIALNEDVVTGP